MFNLQNKVVVIIGGGKSAYRKASGLKIQALLCLARNLRGRNSLLGSKNFSNDDIKDAHLIYAATNQHAVNMMVKQAPTIFSGLTL